MPRWILATIVALASIITPAAADTVTDCPNRDSPFSSDAPLIDLLLSPTARALVDHESGGRLEKAPMQMFGTEPPSFAAIITLKDVAPFIGLNPEAVASLDAKLRNLPVTPADRLARCARYDNEVPHFDSAIGRPRVLLFEKINGFKDEPSVKAANAAIRKMAERKGWALSVTDKAGVFNAHSLRQFDVAIWNNISGDVLTLSQRSAFVDWLNRGGGYVGLHGSAGDPVYFWDWYADTLIGARFAGHPMNPQFQEARIVVEKTHPLAGALPAEWRMTDEWYSFETNPRASGAEVVLTLDEGTYKPEGAKGDLRMGDHPLAWTNCIGKGRMFYSAIGHLPQVYDQPQHVSLLEAAIAWVAGGEACESGVGKK